MLFYMLILQIFLDTMAIYQRQEQLWNHTHHKKTRLTDKVVTLVSTDLGSLHLDPDGDLGHHLSVDSGEHTGGFLPQTDLEKPYWEVLGKKK